PSDAPRVRRAWRGRARYASHRSPRGGALRNLSGSDGAHAGEVVQDPASAYGLLDRSVDGSSGSLQNTPIGYTICSYHTYRCKPSDHLSCVQLKESASCSALPDDLHPPRPFAGP